MPSPVSRRRTEGAAQRGPLALQQQRMWFFERAQPGTSVMNIAVGIRMRGAIDDQALEHALRLLASRHDMLRVQIEDVGNGPEQIVQPDASFPFSQIDLRRREPADAEREVSRLFTEEVDTPFDLGRCPLWRARLVHVAIDQRVLFVTFHHVIADGWSLGVMVRDIAEFYAALVEHRRAVAPGAGTGLSRLRFVAGKRRTGRDDGPSARVLAHEARGRSSGSRSPFRRTSAAVPDLFWRQRRRVTVIGVRQHIVGDRPAAGRFAVHAAGRCVQSLDVTSCRPVRRHRRDADCGTRRYGNGTPGRSVYQHASASDAGGSRCELRIVAWQRARNRARGVRASVTTLRTDCPAGTRAS